MQLQRGWWWEVRELQMGAGGMGLRSALCWRRVLGVIKWVRRCMFGAVRCGGSG